MRARRLAWVLGMLGAVLLTPVAPHAEAASPFKGRLQVAGEVSFNTYSIDWEEWGGPGVPDVFNNGLGYSATVLYAINPQVGVGAYLEHLTGSGTEPLQNVGPLKVSLSVTGGGPAVAVHLLSGEGFNLAAVGNVGYYTNTSTLSVAGRRGKWKAKPSFGGILGLRGTYHFTPEFAAGAHVGYRLLSFGEGKLNGQDTDVPQNLSGFNLGAMASVSF